MTGFIAMIFYDVLTHAAVSVLWGILVAIAFSLLLIFIIRRSTNISAPTACASYSSMKSRQKQSKLG